MKVEEKTVLIAANISCHNTRTNRRFRITKFLKGLNELEQFADNPGTDLVYTILDFKEVKLTEAEVNDLVARGKLKVS